MHKRATELNPCEAHERIEAHAAKRAPPPLHLNRNGGGCSSGGVRGVLGRTRGEGGSCCGRGQRQPSIHSQGSDTRREEPKEAARERDKPVRAAVGIRGSEGGVTSKQRAEEEELGLEELEGTRSGGRSRKGRKVGCGGGR